MRFDLTDEQRGIRDAARALCTRAYDQSALRARMRGGDEGVRLWRELARNGWAGIAVSAEHHGQGLGMVELALVCDELGMVLAPATFVATAAAAIAVERGGTATQQARWLPGFASGDAPAALATVQADGGALALDADGAAALLLIGGTRVSLAPADAYTLEDLDGVDVTRRLTRPSRIAALEELKEPAAVMDRIEVCLSAELVGVAQRALDIAVHHARTREQFGRPIGAYQAVSHRAADMLIAVESARSAVLSAAWTADNSADDLPFAASVAKSSAAAAAWECASGALQIHGGIGFTWEHECHLLLRRAAATSRLLHGADWHLERAASLRGLAPAV